VFAAGCLTFGATGGAGPAVGSGTSVDRFAASIVSAEAAAGWLGGWLETGRRAAQPPRSVINAQQSAMETPCNPHLATAFFC